VHNGTRKHSALMLLMAPVVTLELRSPSRLQAAPTRRSHRRAQLTP
jgi:hypothetical protein